MTNLNLNAFLPTFEFQTIGFAVVTAIGFWNGERYYDWLRESEDQNLVWEFLQFIRTNYGESKSFKGIKLFGHRAANVANRFMLHELERRDETMSFYPTLQSLTWLDPNVRFDDSSMHLKKPRRYLEARGIDVSNPVAHYLEEEKRQPTTRAQLHTSVLELSAALTQWYKDWWQSFGIEPSTTYMTTTLTAVRKNFCTADFDLSKNATKFNLGQGTEKFVRKAIYGMRNEVYQREAGEGAHGDIHSHFPSCYDTSIPAGKFDWAKVDINDPLAAVVDATVHVPEDAYIGPLPYHDGEDRLIFPVGTFRDWYDVPELRNAVDNYGATIVEIHRQLNCEKWSPMLKEFAIAIEENDLFPAENKKLIAIGPSGKMGQHRWRTEVKHWRQMSDAEFTSFLPVGDTEMYCEIMRFNKSPYIIPAVTMRIRAEGRVRHLKLLTEARKHGSIWYCDSDSIFCSRGAVPMKAKSNARVGEVVLVDTFDRGYFIRQKLYGIVSDGSLKQRSAGYSDTRLKEEDFQKLLNDETVLDQEAPQLSNLRQQLSTRELELFTRRNAMRGSAAASRVAVGNDTKPICLGASDV